MTLRRGYLEHRRNVIQLLSDNREQLSRARQAKKRFCEMAEELTHSLVERWPPNTECPFQPVSAEEIAEFQRRLRYQGRQVDQPERHWRREPATYGIRLEERTDIYGQQRTDPGLLQIALRPSVTASSDDGSGSGKAKRTVLEMNERARRAQHEMTAPESRKDSQGGWSKGKPSSKGNTGFYR